MLALVLSAEPVFAQERNPAERQKLVDLARILGESHWIRRVCTGGQDQSWYGRMEQLLAVEAADQGLKRRLSLSFNDGYHAAEALYPQCVEAARTEARRIAKTAQGLSETLAGP